MKSYFIRIGLFVLALIVVFFAMYGIAHAVGITELDNVKDGNTDLVEFFIALLDLVTISKFFGSNIFNIHINSDGGSGGGGPGPGTWC